MSDLLSVVKKVTLDDFHTELSRTEEILMDKLVAKSMGHDSRGSYAMLAMARVKGSFVWGKNKIHRPANTVSKDYPAISGMHAELDLWRQADSLDGCTVYVGGNNIGSRNPMSNTCPCLYCLALLYEAGVQTIIFKRWGQSVKVQMNQIPIKEILEEC